ncbi:MAG: hypothetical protein HY696_12135 [Deltaproteobacteria bacterium]|nr:hypothetical protein [Deltaproteobacteria bacterium]
MQTVPVQRIGALGPYTSVLDTLLIGFDAKTLTARGFHRPPHEINGVKPWTQDMQADQSVSLSDGLLVAPLPNDRNQVLLLLSLEAETGQEYGILALVNIVPQPHTTATLGVQKDRRLDFFTEDRVHFYSIADGTSAVFVDNHHSNTGETFQNLTLIGVTATGLHSIYDGPDLYHYSSAADGCAHVMKPQFQPLAARHGGYHDIQMTVVQSTTCSHRPPSLKTYPATLQWNPSRQKYMGGSKALSKAVGAIAGE